MIIVRDNNKKLFPLFENRSFLHTRLSLHCSAVFTPTFQKFPLTHYLLSIYFRGLTTSLDSPDKCGCLHRWQHSSWRSIQRSWWMDIRPSQTCAIIQTPSFIARKLFFSTADNYQW